MTSKATVLSHCRGSYPQLKPERDVSKKCRWRKQGDGHWVQGKPTVLPLLRRPQFKCAPELASCRTYSHTACESCVSVHYMCAVVATGWVSQGQRVVCRGGAMGIVVAPPPAPVAAAVSRVQFWRAGSSCSCLQSPRRGSGSGRLGAATQDGCPAGARNAFLTTQFERVYPEVNLVTALVPSDTACFDSSPKTVCRVGAGRSKQGKGGGRI